ncbi:MAG: hypothetical protein PHN44_07295 [Candidatus Marinimicrobia bacterium]|nr:hypothetical protein [Candidatus Neomarinimicrobiota bacterium]
MAKTYTDRLKDPRWQQKRLFIFARDSWKCRFCGRSEKTLCVHHLYYLGHIEPWDAPDCSLITLCEDCHGRTDEQFSDFIDAVREYAFLKHALNGLTKNIETQPFNKQKSLQIDCLIYLMENMQDAIKQNVGSCAEIS